MRMCCPAPHGGSASSTTRTICRAAVQASSSDDIRARNARLHFILIQPCCKTSVRKGRSYAYKLGSNCVPKFPNCRRML